MIPVEFIVDGFDIRTSREKTVCVLANARMFSSTKRRRKKCKTKQICWNIFQTEFWCVCHCNGCWKMKLLHGIIELPLIISDFIMIYGQTLKIIQIIALVRKFFFSVCVSVYLWVHYLPLCECVFVCVRVTCKWVYCHRPNANRLKTVFCLSFFLSFISYIFIFKQWKITIKERKKKISIAIADIWLLCKWVSKQGPTIMNGQENERAKAQAQAQASCKRYFEATFIFKQKFVNCSHWTRVETVCVCAVCVCVFLLCDSSDLLSVCLCGTWKARAFCCCCYCSLLLLPLPSLLFFRYYFIVVIFSFFICLFIFSTLLSNYILSQNICAVHTAHSTLHTCWESFPFKSFRSALRNS